MEMDGAILDENLTRFFSERGDVAAVFHLPEAYAFPRPRREKGLDLGVLLHPLVAQCRYEETRLVLAEALAVELNRPDVSVVILNDASSNLAFDLLRRCAVVYCGSENLVEEFRYRVQAEYFRSVHDRRVSAIDGSVEPEPPAFS